MVVAFHAGLPLPGGYTGVDVFFVISGFVIGRLLLEELARTGRISFSAFYARWIRRLLPALALVTTFTVIAGIFLESPFGEQQTTDVMGRATSIFVANIVAYQQPAGYFGTGSVANPMLHMWSLGVEEQFYLFFPLSLLLAWAGLRRWARRPQLLMIPLGAVSVASFALSVVLTSHNEPLAFFMFPTRVWEFGAGAALAILEPRIRRQGSFAISAVIRVSGLALLCLSCSNLVPAGSFPGWEALLPVTGASLFIYAGTMDVKPTVNFAYAPLQLLGDLSYSWYLWHWPLIVLWRAAEPTVSWPEQVAALVSLIPAYLSFRLVEVPMRRVMSRRRLRTVFCLGGLCVLLPLAISEGSLRAAESGWGNHTFAAFTTMAGQPTLATTSGCLWSGTANLAAMSRCRLGDRRDRRVVLLVGDSHAGAISNAVVSAAGSLGYGVQLATGSSCPFTSVSSLENSDLANCAALYAWGMHALSADPRIAAVVMAHADDERADELAGMGVSDPVRVWLGSIRATLATIARRGVPVLVVDDVPRIGNQPIPCRFGVVFALSCSVPRSFVTATQGLIRTRLNQVVEQFRSDAVVDLDPLFCDAEECDAIQDGRLLYLDNQHLNAGGSDYVATTLTRSLERLLQRSTRPHGSTQQTGAV